MVKAPLLYVALAVASSPAALASLRVVGGTAIDVRAAPWSVGVEHGAGGSGVFCSGAILDATHVLTAAHCVVDASGAAAPPSTFTVRAGATNVLAPPSDRQDRQVAAVRVHPGYAAGAEADDVAVLVLSSPLDLGGAAAQALALPPPGLKPAAGRAVSLAGYGVRAAGATLDGSLSRMTSTLAEPSSCLTAREAVAGAVLVCAFSGTNSPCHGDSGSALVLDTPAPVAIGVTSAATCSANTAAVFGNLTAPEVLQFVEGSDNPPVAPRVEQLPAVDRPTALLQVGQTVRCEPGRWSGEPAFAYHFFEHATGSQVGSGSSYRLRLGDNGRQLVCRVAATNAGGTAEADSPPTVAVRPAPDLSIRPAAARPGGGARLAVALTGWVRPVRSLAVCAVPSARVGRPVCRRLALATGTRSTVELPFAVAPSAPAGPARVRVTARAADGRSAAEVALVRIG
jgi:hypothetical protein